MIHISLTSPDVTRQIGLLKDLPKIAAKHYRPALSRVTKALKAAILPNIPVATGQARKDFGSKVTGSTIKSLKGQVGWYDSNDVWYPRILEYGARPHPLTSGSSVRSRAKFARFQSAVKSGETFPGTPILMRGIGWRTIKIHPGISAIGFMAAGYSALKPMVDRELQAANEAVVRELKI